MNVLASLLRVVFSIIVLLALACYLQADPTISLSEYCNSINPARLVVMLSDFNAVTISLVVIVLLGIFHFTRILEAAWNILFCASILVMLACALYAFGGPGVALPTPLYHNDTILELCEMGQEYQVPVAIICLIFLAGWICASACLRVVLTAVISFGLWYGLTEVLTLAVNQWAKSANPGMPEALQMIQSSPWIIAAVPAAFFLIYALLMAFFETFITKARRAAKASAPAEKKESPKKVEKAPAKPEAVEAPGKEEKEEAKPQTTEHQKASKPEARPVLKPVEPVAKSKPILKTAAATPAPQKKLNVVSIASLEEKKDEPKPAEEVSAPAPEAKEESTPAEKAEQTADTEAVTKEEAPVAPAPAEDKPAAESKPAGETDSTSEQKS